MAGTSSPSVRHARIAWPLALLLVPLAGLFLLLAAPELDAHWEHHPSHFWIVLITAAVNAVLAYLANLVAGRHRDARLVLVSLAFLASAGFLGLHALATPGVLLSHPNTGFVVATPVGLMLASVFMAGSISPLAGPRAAWVLHRRTLLLAVLVASMVAWAVVSLADLPPLQGAPPDQEAIGALDAFAIASVFLYAFAAGRYLDRYHRRGGVLILAVAVASILLGEAMIAVVLSRNWRLSWWEWHILMLAAFIAIAWGAREEYRRSGSLAGVFGGLYLEATLARVDRWYAGAIAAVAEADARGESTERVLTDLRREGATSDEVALLAQAAGELRRLDDLLRPYLPTTVTERIRREPGAAALGREDERVVSVLFADLAGFTTFSETRRPAEVVRMLNAFWEVVVPVIEEAGGVIEHFAGDGVMATFNALTEQPDHALRAARTGLAIVGAARTVSATHPDWPSFRVGVNTGPAVVANVGAAGRRTLAVIGDIPNTAARLMAAGAPGEVTIAQATWERLETGRDGTPLGRIRVKGRGAPVEAWTLHDAG